MKSTLPRVDQIAGTDSELSATGQSPVEGQGERSESSTHARTGIRDPEARADAIGQTAPFSAWPRAALLRLAGAAILSSHRSGAQLMAASRRDDNIIVVASGTVISSVSSPGGRRVVFKFDDSSYVYGLFSLVDGLAQGHDLVADGPVAVIGIPHAAIRSELQRMPSLWETLAVEAARRARGMNLQMQQFVFDAPLVRAASLLLGMVAKNGYIGARGPVAIELRLSQERLAELLGTSRQWVTALVRELSTAGLVEWRYGRATVLDVQALRALAARSIDAANQCSEHLAGKWRVELANAPVAVALDPGQRGGARRCVK